MTRQTIAVWFSCGAASAVAAKKTIEMYSHSCNVRVVNNPIKEEDEDNRRFLHDIAGWIRQPIESAINPKYPNCSVKEVWEERGYMEGVAGAPCTLELKKEARRCWEEINKPDWHVLGFTYEEQKRHDSFVKRERSNVLPVLIRLKLSKQDCFDILSREGITLPKMYALGYPNANCIGCVKATSPTYWNHVRQQHPEIFKERSVQSRTIGCKLVRYKGERVYLSQLPKDAKGRPLKTYKMPECGVFCEEQE